MKKLVLLLVMLSFAISAKPLDLSKEGSWKKKESYLVDSKGRRAKGLDLESKDYIMVFKMVGYVERQSLTDFLFSQVLNN